MLGIARRLPPRNQVLFLKTTDDFVRAAYVNLDVRCPVAVHAHLLLVVAQAVIQIAGLADVNRLPITVDLLRVYVVAGLTRSKRCPARIHVIGVRLPGCPGPTDCLYCLVHKLSVQLIQKGDQVSPGEVMLIEAAPVPKLENSLLLFAGRAAAKAVPRTLRRAQEHIERRFLNLYLNAERAAIAMPTGDLLVYPLLGGVAERSCFLSDCNGNHDNFLC